ncbi:MAG TPA: hypothetical protein VGJ32_05330 [Solirubrobacteraceae bacterium]|jgi:hypothetical protein
MSPVNDTPAARARARRDPALAQPPPRPVGSRTSSIRNLHLRVAGRTYPIGANVEGDTPWEMTLEGAATVTIPLRSPDESLLDVLADEALLQEQGVRLAVDDVVYVLVSVAGDDTGLYTLVFEDEVAWRLRQFTRFLARSRKTHTRALFIQGMVDEASRKPLAPMRSFVPELGDRQRILSPKASS